MTQKRWHNDRLPGTIGDGGTGVNILQIAGASVPEEFQ